MIKNRNSDHTTWAVVNVHASDRVTAFGQFVLTDSAASFRGPSLNAGSLPGTPPGFDYTAASDLGKYSELDVRWWGVEAGLRHALRNFILMDYALTYQNYRDGKPYLFDTTGKSLGFVVRGSWMF